MHDSDLNTSNTMPSREHEIYKIEFKMCFFFSYPYECVATYFTPGRVSITKSWSSNTNITYQNMFSNFRKF